MKIVHINTTDNRGGAARVAQRLHAGLNKTLGFSSHMLVREKNSEDNTVSQFGVTGWRRWASVLTSRDHTFIGGDVLLDNSWIQNADIVHLHNLHGYYFHLPILEKLVQLKKVVWTLHDMWPLTGHCGYSISDKPNSKGVYPCGNRFEYVPIIWDRSAALANSKKAILDDLDIHYVTPSHWLARKKQTSYLSTPACTVIPNGFDTDIFNFQKQNKDTLRKQLGIDTNKRVALLIANKLNNPKKGAGTVEKLLDEPQLKNVVFVAIGSGKPPNHPRLLHIPYISSQRILAQYYTIADVFLHPAFVDNFPSVVCEALLCGTPIVAYDVGGIKEQLRDMVDGRLVKPGAYDQYLSAISDVIHEKLSLHDAKAIAARSAKMFSVHAMLEQYTDLYRSL